MVLEDEEYGTPSNTVRDFVAQIETILSETISKIAQIHDHTLSLKEATSLLPELKLMLAAIASAQTVQVEISRTMSHSAESMAQTFQKAEERAAELQRQIITFSNALAGDGRVPLKSHYWTSIMMMVPTMVMATGVILGVLYITRQDVKASLTEIQINQNRTQEIVREAQDKITEQVAKELK